jgi:hypothetical protein
MLGPGVGVLTGVAGVEVTQCTRPMKCSSSVGVIVGDGRSGVTGLVRGEHEGQLGSVIHVRCAGHRCPSVCWSLCAILAGPSAVERFGSRPVSRRMIPNGSWGVSSSKHVHRVGGCARPSSCGPQPHRSDTSQCNRVSLIQSRAPTTGAFRAQRSPVAGAFSRERFECGGASPWSYPRRRRLSSSTAPRSSFRHSSKPHVRASGNDAADAVPHTVQPVGVSAAPYCEQSTATVTSVRRADHYCDVALH